MAFEAEMHGTCPACGDDIFPGDDIERTSDGKYVHAGECFEEWGG